MTRRKNKQNNKQKNTRPTPQRKSTPLTSTDQNSLYVSPGVNGGQLRSFSEFDITDLGRIYSASLQKDKKIRPTVAALRAFADQLPAWSAITTVIDGIAQMDIVVEPPEDKKEDPEALKTAKAIKESLLSPNVDEQPTYRDFISAVVSDLLVGNVSCVERQKSDTNPDHPIWMWVVDFDRIELNAEWSPNVEGIVPRYWDRGPTKTNDRTKWIPLFNKDLFCIREYTNSWRIGSKSVIEVAFRLVAAWKALFDYQEKTTGKPTHGFLIDIGEASSADVDAFRQFFEVAVQEEGAIPIFGSRGSRGINVVPLDPVNDEGLYLKYHETILRLIALAFKLTSRDMNIVEPDNKATANVSADASFQKAILPVGSIVIRAIQVEIVNRYYPGYTVKHIDTEPRSEKDEAETAAMLYDKGLATKNEARMRSKLSNIGIEGNVYKDQQDSGNLQSEDLQNSSASQLGNTRTPVGVRDKINEQKRTADEDKQLKDQ